MDKFWENRNKGCLGPFWDNFGYVSHMPAIRFWCRCTYKTLKWCRISRKKFRSNRIDRFWENRKKANFGHFGLILAMFLTFQQYDFDAIAHMTLIWCRLTRKNFVRTVWTVLEKIKKSRNWLFFGHFLAHLAMFLTSQHYDFDATSHIGL